MSEISGIYRDGQIELDSSVDWPNGARVRVVTEASVACQQGNGSADDYKWGIDEADYKDTPAFRAELMAQMDSFEPPELTPEEEAEWNAARKWIKDFTVAAVRKQMGL